MPQYEVGEAGDLFDLATGKWVGVVNKAGVEQMVGGADVASIADVLKAAATGAPADLARIQSSVSGDVITSAAAIADTGPRQHLTPARISDGDEIGTPVVWWSPTGSGGFWGYAISPTDKFGA